MGKLQSTGYLFGHPIQGVSLAVQLKEGRGVGVGNRYMYSAVGVSAAAGSGTRYPLSSSLPQL